jgi:PAS domain S-box-containing protein
MPPSPDFDAPWNNLIHERRLFDAAGDGLIVSALASGRVIDANPAAGAMHGFAREELIGLDLTTFVHPDSHPVFTAYVAAVHSGGAGEALIVHVRRDGSLFHGEMRGSIVTIENCPCLVSVVRDVSNRVKAEQLHQQRMMTRMIEQAKLLEISHTLASALALTPALILDQVREIIDYTQAGIFTLKDAALVLLAVRGPQQLEQAASCPIRLGDPRLLAALGNSQQPQRIADVWSADPAAQILRSLFGDQAAMLLAGVQAWMWVPLATQERRIGFLGVAHAERNAFTAHHADLALTVANQAAIAMVNTELYEQAQLLAVLHERQRLAQELHDAVNQSLFSAGLIAEVLPRLWEQNPEEGRQSLRELRRLTHGALAEMRMLVAELRPAALTDPALGDLLRLLANALTGRTNIPVVVTITGEGVLPGPVQVAFYRVGQEALNNIARHAAASRAEILLQHGVGTVELHIRDDGRGFDPARIPAGHYGLSIMAERAGAVGALLSVTSQPGHGAKIVLQWTETKGE